MEPSLIAWMAVAAGIALPNLIFAGVRRRDSGRTGTASTHALSAKQRRFLEGVTRAAWLTPSMAVAVMYLLGHGFVQIVFGAVLVLAVALNLLLLTMLLTAFILGRRART